MADKILPQRVSIDCVCVCVCVGGGGIVKIVHGLTLHPSIS